jgi:hypothetical protein
VALGIELLHVADAAMDLESGEHPLWPKRIRGWPGDARRGAISEPGRTGYHETSSK